MNHDKPRRCPACRQATLQPTTRVREFQPHGRDVRVELLTSYCPACGNEATSAAQHTENLSRLKARKDQYQGLLLGEEILALRRRYGITQQTAAKIFGKGKIAFSRYENETSYPDATATLLLKQAIQNPGVIKSLADEAGVELPLWKARCEAERDVKVRVISDVRAADPAARRWAQRELSASGGGRVNYVPISSSFQPDCWAAKTVTASACNDERFGSGTAYG